MERVGTRAWARGPTHMEAPAVDPVDGEVAGEVEGEVEAQVDGHEEAPLSKRQQKKQLKREMMKGKRVEKKQAVKQAKRAKRAASQIEWDAMTEEAREEQRQKSAVIRAKREAAEAEAAAAAAAANDETRALPTCVLDLSFGELMKEGEIGSLAQQLSYAYSANRRAGFPMRLVFASLGGSLEAHLTTGYQNWVAVSRDARGYLELYSPERLVYLSSESDEVLEAPLDAEAVYVVGGLVDHNREKGLTHRLAVEAGIRTARLPIDEHLAMAQRRVLAVNHVVDILAQVAGGHDWRSALMSAIPERRGAKERSCTDAEDEAEAHGQAAASSAAQSDSSATGPAVANG